MVSVTTQKASNPLHKVAASLNLPGLQLITKKLELPVKVVFPRNLCAGLVPGSSSTDYIMLGLGDMAVPGMLLALALCFDHRESRDVYVRIILIKAAYIHMVCTIWVCGWTDHYFSC
ncbi:hypothetical protein GW17_00026773 [Ensete ventricosum]|nr:hypothetical protein GW17_00026773 [Ensete ventricosum]